MKTIRNNRIVVNLNKAQYATFYYRNQYGQTSYIKPEVHTLRSQTLFDKEKALFHPNYPGETEYVRAKRLNLIDVWTPEISFKLEANSCLIYTGTKAVALNKAWNAKIFGGKKK